MISIRTGFVLSVALLLAACAAPPIVLSDRATNDFQVQLKQVNIDNLSIEAKVGVNDVVWVNGWVPVHTGFQPSLNNAFTSKLKNSIVPVGENGIVDISVMRVGFFMEKNYGDDIAFVGLFMAGRERGFKCDADLNIKSNIKSERVTFKHEIKRSYFDNIDEIAKFIEVCQTDLVKQVSFALTGC